MRRFAVLVLTALVVPICLPRFSPSVTAAPSSPGLRRILKPHKLKIADLRLYYAPEQIRPRNSKGETVTSPAYTSAALSLLSTGRPLEKKELKSISKALQDYIRKEFGLVAPLTACSVNVVMDYNLKPKRRGVAQIRDFTNFQYAAAQWQYRDKKWEFYGEWIPGRILKTRKPSAPKVEKFN